MYHSARHRVTFRHPGRPPAARFLPSLIHHGPTWLLGQPLRQPEYGGRRYLLRSPICHIANPTTNFPQLSQPYQGPTQSPPASRLLSAPPVGGGWITIRLGDFEWHAEGKMGKRKRDM